MTCTGKCFLYTRAIVAFYIMFLIVFYTFEWKKNELINSNLLYAICKKWLWYVMNKFKNKYRYDSCFCHILWEIELCWKFSSIFNFVSLYNLFHNIWPGFLFSLQNDCNVYMLCLRRYLKKKNKKKKPHQKQIVLNKITNIELQMKQHQTTKCNNWSSYNNYR